MRSNPYPDCVNAKLGRKMTMPLRKILRGPRSGMRCRGGPATLARHHPSGRGIMNHRTPSLPPKTALTRFSVAPLSTMTRRLADVASGRAPADLVVTGARVLSTYSERIAPEREVWIAGGRIAAVKPAGAYRQVKGQPGRIYDARGGIVAPGLVDPHIHIESSMVTACAYAEAALLNGTTTIFCDSHEIGNVMDVSRHRDDAGGCAPRAALDLPHGAEHGAGHHARSRDRRRRPDARQDRGALRPLARGRGARREDGFRARDHGRRTQPRDPRRGSGARQAGLRPHLRPRIRGGLCGERRHRHARGDRSRHRRRSARCRHLDLPARRPAHDAVAFAAGSDQDDHGTRRRRTSASASAPTTAMRTISCCSAWIG